MTDNEPWRELYRTDDLIRARAVATSIAAMEFEVHLIGADDHDDQPLGEEPQPAPADFSGPFIIEVRETDLPTLTDALDEIIREQQEFDAEVEENGFPRASPRLLIGLVLAIILVYLAFRYLT